MTTHNRGVGKFTAQSLRAVRESNGSYADVARVAEDYDGDIHANTIDNWIQTGSANIHDGNNATAYARFAKIYSDQLKEHGGAETNRTRELHRALEIHERTCECGNQKILLEDGTAVDQCQVCRALDATPRHDGSEQL